MVNNADMQFPTQLGKGINHVSSTLFVDMYLIPMELLKLKLTSMIIIPQ